MRTTTIEKRRIASISLTKFLDANGNLRGWQPRAELPAGMIQEYTQLLLSKVDLTGRLGVDYPIAFVDSHGFYWLADGFERGYAHIDAGRKYMDVELRIGSERDAKLFAVGANAEHGSRRTAADRRRCIRELLQDPEWKERDDDWIAEHTKTSTYLVNEVRAEFEGQLTEEQERVTKTGTRKKVKPARSKKTSKPRFRNRNYTVCPTCDGKGVIPAVA